MSPRQYAKALTAALIAALSVLAGAVGDGVSAEEWITTAIAFLTALGVVFVVPNQAPAGQPANPDLSEQDGRDLGRVDPLYAALVVFVIVVVLLLLGVL